MTPEQNVVFSALARGRLIFPFREEMNALREQAARGPLIEDEAARLAVLSDAFEKIKKKDEWFHSAMEGGDMSAAGKIAAEALEMLRDLA